MQFQITSYLFSCCRNPSVVNSHLLRYSETLHSTQSRFSAGKIFIAGCGALVEGSPMVITTVVARTIFTKLMVWSPAKAILFRVSYSSYLVRDIPSLHSIKC